jgi:hypothetical protein
MFLLGFCTGNVDAVCSSAQKCRTWLKAPVFTVNEYLENLEIAGLVKTVALLKRHKSKL